MKHYKLLLIILLPIMFAFGGCKQNTDTAKMTPEEILNVLDIKIHKHPKDDQLYFDRAKIYLKLNRVNDAIADLSRAVALDKDNIDYNMLLGDAYFANHDMNSSFRTFQKVLDLDPGNTEAYLKLGEISYYSRDYDRAMESLSKVTEKDPRNRTALFMKSFIYKETGDTNKAITLLGKICDYYPEFPEAFEEIGTLYALNHNPLALEYLNTAIRLNPKNTSARYSIAMFYQEQNQIDKAEEYYKQILDIDSGHKDAWHNRGYIETFLYGDYEEAIGFYTKAIQCDSNFIEAWTNRGCTYELMGNKALAHQDFTKAVSIDGTYEPAIEGFDRTK